MSLLAFLLLCVALVSYETPAKPSSVAPMAKMSSPPKPKSRNVRITRPLATKALRELRREHEMRLAIDMQKEWKSKNGVHVEGAKSEPKPTNPITG